jgi:serine/threonine protein kinase
MASLSTSNSKTDTAILDDEIQAVKLALDSAIVKKDEAQKVVDELFSKLGGLRKANGRLSSKPCLPVAELESQGDHWPSEAEQYLVGAKIGSGAFAVVHHAKRKADGKDCAGKLPSEPVPPSLPHSSSLTKYPFLASLLFLFGCFS